MAGAYLTKAVRRSIIENNWKMVTGEIERAFDHAQTQARLSRHLPLLKAMLKAARAWDAKGVLKSARKLCHLTKKVPPGCYYRGGRAFRFSSQRVSLPKSNDS